MVTAFATTENAIQAMKLGAYDYVQKPFKVDELKLVVAKALERPSPGGREPGPAPAGEAAVRRRDHRRLAGHRRGARGGREGGPGTEHHPHHRGERAWARRWWRGPSTGAAAAHDQPFVAVNCGAIPEGLIESELFGHEKGSFTGAFDARAGLFEVAGTGTLFLDEVGELPPAMQVRLLRALQERRIRRVGGSRDLPVAARIVAATNRDLDRGGAAGPVPRGPLLPAQRHPHPRRRRSGSGARTSPPSWPTT